MSQQFQPQIYPYNNVPIHPDNTIPSSQSSSSSSSHSNGSFGTVFLVLGVILVVSVLACIANRLCSRRRSNNHDDHVTKSHGKLPREWERKHSPDFLQQTGGGDLELGMKRIIPSAKVADAGAEPSSSTTPFHNGGGKEARLFAVHHDDSEGKEARFAVHHHNGGGKEDRFAVRHHNDGGKEPRFSVHHHNGGGRFAVHHMEFKP